MQHVIVVGGGIGGLTAALCLAAKGFRVAVLEQSDRITEIGAGIQISPNGNRVLFDLGLSDALEAVAFRPQMSERRDWQTGEVLAGGPLGDSVVEKYDFPYYHIHRADLIRVLADAAGASPHIELYTNLGVADFQQDADGVRVHDRSGGVHRADILVGADGIRSVVREGLFGPAAPTFTGNIAWRSLIPTGKLPDGLVRPAATAWWGPGRHFVHYYVRGGAFVNCVAVVEKEGWEVESWTEKGDIAELRADFAGWHDDLQTLIDAMDSDACFKWALFDRPPMNQWGSGRVTLLGDACHPTLPFMAQGAVMAIEDGAVLAGCLSMGMDVPDALQRYEDLRRDRTASIQNGSRRNAKLFHLHGDDAVDRNQSAGDDYRATIDRLYRYDALTAHLGEQERTS
ncbi:FAD-dependent oxidoreductase [Minwuia sp.]|uniref:FAD-dependent oxidoreductase n=1 Tax=Minwuia sp. TaxID=2493630 RepID=UPI003A922072